MRTFVFVTANWRPLGHRNVSRQYDKLVRRTKAADAKPTWHNLRDTYVARLIRSGADVYSVSEVAGHGNSGFTLSRYGAVPKGEQPADAARAAFEAAVGRLL